MVISSSFSNEQLITAIHNAAEKYNCLTESSYLIIGNNQKPDFLWFQCLFEKQNFMHLAGLDSPHMYAEEFFEKAVNNELRIQDCRPSRDHGRAMICEKCSCLADMVDFSNAKYMKIGYKDRATPLVDFTYAYGQSAIIGFRETAANICFPVTLIPNCIENYSSTMYRVAFVCKKPASADLYERPFVEAKRNLFDKLFPDFPPELKNLFAQKNGSVG